MIFLYIYDIVVCRGNNASIFTQENSMIRYYNRAPHCIFTDTEIYLGRNEFAEKVDVEQELREVTQSMSRYERYMITIVRKAYISTFHCQIRIWRKFPFEFRSDHIDSMGIEGNLFGDIVIEPTLLEDAHEAAIQKVIKTLQCILKDRYHSIDRIYKLEGMPVEFILCA